ncbi:hypothetical protein [Metallibacterium scheffleri]|uniref:hypothetical protein n=1 Tax=Metallibacterium scheffleri TaxID=993689 RepID=UPI00109EE935|nr:hypothetical protein [Metallibacterium scheffleri]
MAKYLYEVSLERGRDNPAFSAFLKNAMNLNGKAPDFGGISRVCLVSHHMDIDTIRLLFEEGLKKSKSDLSVEEITKDSLESLTGHHRIYTDTIKNLFLPYDSYPNIK